MPASLLHGRHGHYMIMAFFYATVARAAVAWHACSGTLRRVAVIVVVVIIDEPIKKALCCSTDRPTANDHTVCSRYCSNSTRLAVHSSIEKVSIVFLPHELLVT